MDIRPLFPRQLFTIHDSVQVSKISVTKGMLLYALSFSNGLDEEDLVAFSCNGDVWEPEATEVVFPLYIILEKGILYQGFTEIERPERQLGLNQK